MSKNDDDAQDLMWFNELVANFCEHKDTKAGSQA